MKKKRELLELVGTLCNGEMTPGEASRLDELLDGDTAAQQVYRQYMAMHAELVWQQDALGELPQSCPDVTPKAVFGSGPRAQQFDWRRIGWPAALAACLLVGLAIGFQGSSTDIGAGFQVGYKQAKAKLDRRHDRVICPPLPKLPVRETAVGCPTCRG